MTGNMAENAAGDVTPEKEAVSLSAYWELLNVHDWFYHYRGSPLDWLAGERNNNKLLGIAEQSADHMKLYQQFSDHWKLNDPERPAKPEPAGPS